MFWSPRCRMLELLRLLRLRNRWRKVGGVDLNQNVGMRRLTVRFSEGSYMIGEGFVDTEKRIVVLEQGKTVVPFERIQYVSENGAEGFVALDGKGRTEGKTAKAEASRNDGI